jgi:hypothetical protein
LTKSSKFGIIKKQGAHGTFWRWNYMENYISTKIIIMSSSIIIFIFFVFIMQKLFRKSMITENGFKLLNGRDYKLLKILKFISIIIFSTIIISGIIGKAQASKNIRIFENSNWQKLYSLRNSIIEYVIRNELNPNVQWNNFMCQLPFKSPIVSKGGNDIGIHRYDDNTVAVYFFLSRGLLDMPSTVFVYTNNNTVISNIKKYIENDSYNNWKIEENWYRLFGEYGNNFYIK